MISAVTNTNNFNHTLGARQYELSNHLGNVLAVVSDRKYARDIDNTGEIDYYEPDVLVTYDYSPFGVILKDRNFEKDVCRDSISEIGATDLSNTFDSGLAGWIVAPGSHTNAYVSLVGGQLRIGKTAGTGAFGADQTFAVNYLAQYTLDFDFNRGTLNGANQVKVAVIDPNGIELTSWTVNITPINQTLSFSFNPTMTGTHTLRMTRIGSNNANRYFNIDNLTITHTEEQITCLCDKQGSYRYGFNGMEKDDEVKGQGNSYTTEFRQYDSRLGRWLSIDPEATNISWQSPYVSMDNNPIIFNDPLGDKVKVGKKIEVTKENPGEFSGAKYEPGGNNGTGLVNTKEYNDYLKKEKEYKDDVTKVEAHNKLIDERIALINGSLEGWTVKYDDKTGTVVPSPGTKKKDVAKGGEYDLSVWKAIKSNKTLNISFDATNFVQMSTRTNMSINMRDFEDLYKQGVTGKGVARSQLAGAFTQFNTGSEFKALQAEINELYRTFDLPRAGYMFPFYSGGVEAKARNGVIQYLDKDKSSNGRGVVFEYNARTGKLTKP